MSKGRLEAFSDGVLAIVLTIMVLELKAPHDPSPDALRPLVPAFLSYVLSFVFVGIYWNNHHHMLQAARHVSGGVLWANLHLLFWLSLVPAVTHWMGATFFAALPVAAYGVVMLGAAVAYTVLARVLIADHGKDSPLAVAVVTRCCVAAANTASHSAIVSTLSRPLISGSVPSSTATSSWAIVPTKASGNQTSSHRGPTHSPGRRRVL